MVEEGWMCDGWGAEEEMDEVDEKQMEGVFLFYFIFLQTLRLWRRSGSPGALWVARSRTGPASWRPGCGDAAVCLHVGPKDLLSVLQVKFRSCGRITGRETKENKELEFKCFPSDPSGLFTLNGLGINDEQFET